MVLQASSLQLHRLEACATISFYKLLEVQMSVVIVGSIAIDNIITPTDKADNVLGGEAEGQR